MKYSGLKGMEDILPPDIAVWQGIEAAARRVFDRYGYSEIRVPILESTDIFIRGIGEATDIVEKEMYTFTDKGNRSVSMRPEGTAPVVRCYVEKNLHTMSSPQKFFYSGPMFRYERPQKGRFRQFFQIGAEAFGVAAPAMDAEIIIMLQHLLEAIGLRDLNFEINSIGCAECRPSYRQALLDFFGAKLDEYCPDCRRRYETNPLRILDCKVSRCSELRQGAPVVIDFLCEDCKIHFGDVLSILSAFHVSHTLNPNLVRGLDYYTKTTFEVTSEHLGAQKAVAAGGRYDRLVREFGGPDTPAIGFAMGMERIVALLKEQGGIEQPAPLVYVATLGKAAETEGFKIVEQLRDHGLWAEQSYGSSSLKSQLRRADRIGARVALILGDNELQSGCLQWKDLKQGRQGEVALGNVVDFLKGHA
ncbi:MAG TPA: histidine--tRNA ligase [Dissulfurispiraceae bacterium]|nr:histidine--tRNA ligase [Dissulfurispiraceae bacterium]